MTKNDPFNFKLPFLSDTLAGCVSMSCAMKSILYHDILSVVVPRFPNLDPKSFYDKVEEITDEKNELDLEKYGELQKALSTDFREFLKVIKDDKDFLSKYELKDVILAFNAAYGFHLFTGKCFITSIRKILGVADEQ